VNRTTRIGGILVLGAALAGSTGCLMAPDDEAEGSQPSEAVGDDQYQLPSRSAGRTGRVPQELEELDGSPWTPVRCPDLWDICLAACAGESPVVPDECPVPECVCPPGDA
jgi:hypothetical protein